MKTNVKFEIACRCCLTEHGHMKNLLQDTFEVANGDSIKLLEGFSKCSGINPDPDPVLSNICDSCETKLANAYNFRELCQASNRVLEEHSSVVKQELQSDEESAPSKRDKLTKRKRPGRPKKTAGVPEIIFMKEEPLEVEKEKEKTEPVEEEDVKEESEIPAEDAASSAMDHHDHDDTDSNSIKANDSDFDEDESDKEVIEDADEERKQRALYQCFHCDTYHASYSGLAKHKSSEHPAEYLLPIKRICPVCHVKT
jgi:Zinc-finger associated domain (zf-AD)